MLKLTHFPLCPLSRSIRIALTEQHHVFELIEEHAWKWRSGFLSLNPAGELPVLGLSDGGALCGAYAIVEYLADTAAGPAAGPAAPDGANGFTPQTNKSRQFSLFPGDAEDRAEVRRLVDWFHRKFDREVSRDLLAEKVYPRVLGAPSNPAASAGPSKSPAPPDPEVLRAVRTNLRHHMSYVGFLADQRRWLAGDEPSFADLAAAAHLSVADFLGELPWDSHPAAKAWYQRIKSRPSFRPLLADRLAGFSPPAHYADLDF